MPARELRRQLEGGDELASSGGAVVGDGPRRELEVEGEAGGANDPGDRVDAGHLGTRLVRRERGVRCLGALRQSPEAEAGPPPGRSERACCCHGLYGIRSDTTSRTAASLTFQPGRRLTLGAMERLTVSEVAARTGFSPSALRYYDKLGLVRPPDRSEAGYRLYDEGSVQRLGFVARAKRLGLPLGDITDLLELWDDEECGPVQSRLADLVAGKLAETHEGITELAAFADELTALRARLDRAPHPGPCDERCACLVEPPVACTLDVDAVPERIAAWAGLIERTDKRVEIDGGVRFTFPGSSELVAQVAALAAAEQRCCAFLTFTLTFVDGRALLDITAPGHDAEMLPDLFRVAP